MKRWPANLFLLACTLAMNLLLPAVALRSSWSVAACVVTVIVLDACTWLVHRLMHAIPFLWRFHRVHHSDDHVDVTTTLRLHPGENLVRWAFVFVPALVVGLPFQGFVLYRALSALNGLFEHLDAALPEGVNRVLSRLWVTPNMHKVHHSNVPAETNSNYGNLLSIYDRAFRTFTPARPVTYGLDLAPERVRSIRALLVMPFDQNASSSAAPIVSQP